MQAFAECFINAAFSQEWSPACSQILSLLLQKQLWTTEEFVNFVIKNFFQRAVEPMDIQFYSKGILENGVCQSKLYQCFLVRKLH